MHLVLTDQSYTSVVSLLKPVLTMTKQSVFIIKGLINIEWEELSILSMNKHFLTSKTLILFL